MPSGWESKQHHRYIDDLLSDLFTDFFSLVADKKPMTQKDFLKLADRYDLETKMLNIIVDGGTFGAVSSVGIALGLKEIEGIQSIYPSVANKLKTKSWVADDVRLSTRVHKSAIEMSRATKNIIVEATKKKQGLDAIAQGLFDEVLDGGRIPKDLIAKNVRELGDLAKVASKSIQDDAFKKQADILAKKVSVYAEKIKTPTLKNSYKKLVKAYEKGNLQAINSAIENVAKRKSQYIAKRIMRTEVQRAEFEAFFVDIENDDSVKGIKFSLSSSHAIPDVCDIHTGINIGFGSGVYPIYQAPSYPFHPNCFCSYSEVYVKTGLKRSSKVKSAKIEESGDKLLERMSDAKRNKILGLEKSKRWEEGENWQSLQNNYSKPTDNRKAVRFVSEDFNRTN